MQPNDTLAAVAKRVGIGEQQLREANRVPPRYRLAPGSTFLIPRDETMEDDIPTASLDAHFALVPERSNLRKVTYRVRRGDTLHGVARRWGVDEKDVIVWNHLTAPTLFAGRLELTVPAPKARSGKSQVAKGGKANAKGTTVAAPTAKESTAKSPAKAPAKSASKPAPRAAGPIPSPPKGNIKSAAAPNTRSTSVCQICCGPRCCAARSPMRESKALTSPKRARCQAWWRC